jgi:hypothetical protein
MIVRKLQPHEMDGQVTLFQYYFDEAVEVIPSMAEEYDENSVLETIREFAILHTHCWFVALEGQRPVGFVAGFVSECPWNKEILYTNIAFIYLLETHRNMDNFRQLMAEFTSWSKNVKAKKITAGDIGINTDKMRKLYEHFDFKEILLMVKDL